MPTADLHPRARSRPRTGFAASPLALPLTLALVALLAGGCSSVERRVLETDARAGQQVALLSGAPAPTEPPAPEFARFGTLEADVSLRRLIVRPSTWTAFVRGDPEPFLGEEQVDWARAALAAHVSALVPGQRLELRFKDRFHGYPVVVEVYPQGGALMYRFTTLAERPPEASDTANMAALRFVQLQPQPPQQVVSDTTAATLTDPLFGRDETLEQKLALLERAAAEGSLSEAELSSAREAVQGGRGPSLGAVQSLLERLATLKRAREQRLLTAEETATRREALLRELTGG